MVTIRVQSLDDIIKAYFKNLGFESKALENVTTDISERHQVLQNSSDVVAELDVLVSHLAEQIYGKSLPGEQNVAMFKLGFITIKAADEFGGGIFSGSSMPDVFVKKMREVMIFSAPEYKLSRMTPQKIETAIHISFFSKIFNFIKKVFGK